MANVSIIVPVYNVEKYLARCLDSIIAQTARDLEIICVNDGSTDASAAILADYAAKDPRIRVLTQPNGGQAAARNAALAVATGDWVLFVDADDWIPPYAVETFLTAAAESGARVVVASDYAVDRLAAARPARVRWTRRQPALAKLVGRRKLQSAPWNKLFRREVLVGHRFIEGIVFEDWPFVTEVFGDLDAFALVRAPLYVYCKNAGSASTVRSPFTEKKAVSYLTGIAHVAAHFRDHPQRRAARRRCAVAAAMLVNKVSKTKDRALQARVRRELAALRTAGAFRYRDVPFKSLIRLFALRKEA